MPTPAVARRTATPSSTIARRRARAPATAVHDRHAVLGRAHTVVSKELQVHGLRLGRGVGAELVREEATAALVHAKCFRRIARRSVCLHEPAVSVLAEGLQLDHLLPVPDRVGEVCLAERRVALAFQRAHEHLAEVTPPLLDPGAVLAREEAPPGESGGGCRLGARRFDVAGCERRFGVLHRLHRRVDVDPGAGGKRELVAAERARERGRAVDAALLQQRAQLRHQHSQRLLPGRGQLVAPEHLGQLVAGHCTPLLCCQVGEHDPTLPAGEALLAEGRAVRLLVQAAPSGRSERPAHRSSQGR